MIIMIITRTFWELIWRGKMEQIQVIKKLSAKPVATGIWSLVGWMEPIWQEEGGGKAEEGRRLKFSGWSEAGYTPPPPVPHPLHPAPPPLAHAPPPPVKNTQDWRSKKGCLSTPWFLAFWSFYAPWRRRIGSDVEKEPKSFCGQRKQVLPCLASLPQDPWMARLIKIRKYVDPSCQVIIKYVANFRFN